MNNDPVNRKNQDPGVQASEMMAQVKSAWGIPVGVSVLPHTHKPLGKGSPSEHGKGAKGQSKGQKSAGKSRGSKGAPKFKSKTHVGYGWD